MVEVTGSPAVDVVLNRLNGKLMVNLVNTSGPHATELIIDSIPPVGPLTLTLRDIPRPKRITLQPASQNLTFDVRRGEVRVQVPQVAIHEIVVVE
jgi:hypothetical protein